jgi:glycosyltransferase involved in cell wall biosynthesis
LRILLLSAYAAQSHTAWAGQLQQMFNRWDWTVLEMPPRHFSWRVRGNPLHWSVAEKAVLSREYDLILATSMVDLATLRGLVPVLASKPTVLYFHENQFAYPHGASVHGLLEAQMVSLYAALAADQVLFNSQYNRDSFLQGCRDLLQRLPDYVPGGIVQQLQARSSVVPVPVAAPPAGRRGVPASHAADAALQLIWVGRFEHDKGGELLLQVLRRLEELQVDYRVAVVGQQFRQSPAAFASIASDFAHRLTHFGYVQERADYLEMLSAADVVLSTAMHEFQGIAVMEAVMSGCVPVVPDRLAYPEFYPAANRYQQQAGDGPVQAHNAARLIAAIAQDLAAWRRRLPDLSAYQPGALADSYRAAFDAAVRVATGPG